MRRYYIDKIVFWRTCIMYKGLRRGMKGGSPPDFLRAKAAVRRWGKV